MSVGVKVTDNVWLPALSTVPEAGLYAMVYGVAEVGIVEVKKFVEKNPLLPILAATVEPLIVIETVSVLGGLLGG